MVTTQVVAVLATSIMEIGLIMIIMMEDTIITTTMGDITIMTGVVITIMTVAVITMEEAATMVEVEMTVVAVAAAAAVVAAVAAEVEIDDKATYVIAS